MTQPSDDEAVTYTFMVVMVALFALAMVVIVAVITSPSYQAKHPRPSASVTTGQQVG